MVTNSTRNVLMIGSVTNANVRTAADITSIKKNFPRLICDPELNKLNIVNMKKIEVNKDIFGKIYLTLYFGYAQHRAINSGKFRLI